MTFNHVPHGHDEDHSGVPPVSSLEDDYTFLPFSFDVATLRLLFPLYVRFVDAALFFRVEGFPSIHHITESTLRCWL